MRPLLSLILILALVGPASSHEVAGSILFNTGPFQCDGHTITQEWTNTNAYTMYFYGARVFHGRDWDVWADYHTQVTKNDFAGSYLALWQNDAYDRGGHREQETWYGGHYQSLKPGEKLLLYTFCIAHHGEEGKAHTVVTFFWSGQPE